jgi:hypothetical protein
MPVVGRVSIAQFVAGLPTVIGSKANSARSAVLCMLVEPLNAAAASSGLPASV